MHPVTIAKLEKLPENNLLKYELTMWILYRVVGVIQWILGYHDDRFRCNV